MEITVFRLPIANFLPAQAFRRLPRAGASPCTPCSLTICSQHQGSLKTKIPSFPRAQSFQAAYRLFKSMKHHAAHHLVSPHLPTHFAGMARHQLYRLYRHHFCRHQPMGSDRISAADIRARHAVVSHHTLPPVQQSHPHQLAAHATGRSRQHRLSRGRGNVPRLFTQHQRPRRTQLQRISPRPRRQQPPCQIGRTCHTHLAAALSPNGWLNRALFHLRRLRPSRLSVESQ